MPFFASASFFLALIKDDKSKRLVVDVKVRVRLGWVSKPTVIHENISERQEYKRAWNCVFGLNTAFA